MSTDAEPVKAEPSTGLEPATEDRPAHDGTDTALQGHRTDLGPGSATPERPVTAGNDPTPQEHPTDLGPGSATTAAGNAAVGEGRSAEVGYGDAGEE
ncbi:hypothetical protein, partial [Nonomuraea mesophila]|uniref:hypothetical protein n=1 Tax=Nonomuraea mesophila TaxID=2530382 RepID=UPI001C7028FF